MILARDTRESPLRLHHVWFAQNLAPDQYERFAALVGCRPRQLCGMTETGPAVLTDRAATPEPSSLGTPSPGCAVRLAGPARNELQVAGEPGRTLFLGYLDDADATATALHREGDVSWFTTGDRASVDERGRYRFLGRGGDIVKVGGENVSLTEVEALLATHPAFLEVVAVAVPDPVLDEVVAAVFVPAGGTYPPEAELLSWSAERLSPARRPRAFHAVDDLPRTSVGKIKRFEVRQSVIGGHAEAEAGGAWRAGRRPGAQR
jgi:crotonobetaine/carnitine-CoA ligase